MPSRFHAAKQRRAEREPITAHGSINLVPLVDILTSIVFFSLLTYTGEAMAALTSFDLSLPPVVVTAEQAQQIKNERQVLNLLVAVRVDNDRLRVESSQGLAREIPGGSGESLDTLQAVMTQLRQQFPQNSDVTVIPSDDVSYDNLVHVLERLRIAKFRGISLSTRQRSAQVAASGTGGR